jgi:hypothetical protein
MFGEKTNIEYKWGADIKENILYFFFQLVRDQDMTDLENRLFQLLSEIKTKPHKYQEELIVLYKILCHTRDIRCGRGEMDLSYMQLYIWFCFDADLAYFALQQFIWGPKYGSWKDIKKICLFVKQKTNDENHPLIEYACNIMIVQLKHDLLKIHENESISLAGKWAPREKNRKYKWLYSKLATQMYPEFSKTAKNISSKQAALRKAKMFFRKDLSLLNKYLFTTENIMCNFSWSYIYPSLVPSNALYKYRLALQNKTKDNKIRRNTPDRHMCAGYLQHYIENTPIKQSTVPLATLVKGAQDCVTDIDSNIINSLWNAQKKIHHFKQNLLAIVDLSSSMERNNNAPLYTAIALGIRASELAVGAFHDRLFVFSACPTWIKFDAKMTFVDKVNIILSASRGLNSNLKPVLETLIDAFCKTEGDKTTIKDLDLCVFSDMQIDQFSKRVIYTLSENIKKIFIKNGFKTLPRLILWNMRKTSGFPARSNDRRVVLLSGYTDKMFKLLMPAATVRKQLKKRHHSSYPSWSILQRCVNGPRYNILHNKIISKI